jgi:hypothetical protein
MNIDSQTGIVTLMRGDSLIMPIYIDDGTKFNPKYRSIRLNEKVYFGLMEPNKAFEDAVVKKVLDASCDTDENGIPQLILEPKDTENLLVGKYYYMVKLYEEDVYGKPWVKTIVSPTLFWLEGHNPEEDVIERHETDELKVDHVIVDGGLILGDVDDNTRVVVFDGGEIL